MKMTSRIFRASKLPADLAAEWSRLLLVSPTPTAFLSPSYCATSDRIFNDTYVCVIESAGVPQAFFPYAKPSLPARWCGAARPVSGLLTDYVGLICRDNFHMDTELLLRQAGIHSFLFTHLDSSQMNIGLTGEQPRPGLTSNFSGGFELYRAEVEARNKAFVRIGDRRASKLARDCGKLNFILQHDYDADKINLLIRQKIEQYKRTRVANPLANSAAQQFLHALMQLQPSESCSPVFSTLYSGNTLVASHLGLRCGYTLHYWFPVYNTIFSNYSPGRILIWEMIRSAAAAGMRHMDFGEGDTSAKRDFANREHTYYRGFYARNTLQGFTDRALMSFRWRMVQQNIKPAAHDNSNEQEIGSSWKPC